MDSLVKIKIKKDAPLAHEAVPPSIMDSTMTSKYASSGGIVAPKRDETGSHDVLSKALKDAVENAKIMFIRLHLIDEEPNTDKVSTDDKSDDETAKNDDATIVSTSKSSSDDGFSCDRIDYIDLTDSFTSYYENYKNSIKVSDNNKAFISFVNNKLDTREHLVGFFNDLMVLNNPDYDIHSESIESRLCLFSVGLASYAHKVLGIPTHRRVVRIIATKFHERFDEHSHNCFLGFDGVNTLTEASGYLTLAGVPFTEIEDDVAEEDDKVSVNKEAENKVVEDKEIEHTVSQLDTHDIEKSIEQKNILESDNKVLTKGKSGRLDTSVKSVNIKDNDIGLVKRPVQSHKLNSYRGHDEMVDMIVTDDAHENAKPTPLGSKVPVSKIDDPLSDISNSSSGTGIVRKRVSKSVVEKTPTEAALERASKASRLRSQLDGYRDSSQKSRLYVHNTSEAQLRQRNSVGLTDEVTADSEVGYVRSTDDHLTANLHRDVQNRDIASCDRQFPGIEASGRASSALVVEEGHIYGYFYLRYLVAPYRTTNMLRVDLTEYFKEFLHLYAQEDETKKFNRKKVTIDASLDLWGVEQLIEKSALGLFSGVMKREIAKASYNLLEELRRKVGATGYIFDYRETWLEMSVDVKSLRSYFADEKKHTPEVLALFDRMAVSTGGMI